MRSLTIALLGALTVAGLGTVTAAPAQAQDGFATGPVYRVSRPLPIRVRPRSWLDAGNVPLTSNVPGAGGSRNPTRHRRSTAARTSRQRSQVTGRGSGRVRALSFAQGRFCSPFKTLSVIASEAKQSRDAPRFKSSRCS